MEFAQRLSVVFADFARRLLTDVSVEAVLDAVVAGAAEALPVDGVGAALRWSPTDAPRVAGSSRSVLDLEHLQSDLDHGPRLQAERTRSVVQVPDLSLPSTVDIRSDARPGEAGAAESASAAQLAARAAVLGIAGVLSVPLHDGEHHLGVIDFYRAQRGPFDADLVAAASELAEVAAAHLANAQARSDLRDSSERARQSSLHDALTGLPNRTLFVQRLEHAILRCRRSKRMLAILFADLDMFKLVNDTYGHHIGDELLVAVARRLSGILRPGDTLARLSGDEFVILCEDLQDASPAEAVAARIGVALADSFALSGAEVRVSASVGIAFAGRGDEIPEQVLQEADTAMYRAKRRGGARHAIVDLREEHLSAQRASLGRDLTAATTRGQLENDYRPIFEAGTGRMVGAEARLRWVHEWEGVVAPEVFLPLAERSGLGIELGRWMLLRACIDRRTWQEPGHPNRMEVAVNVTAHQLLQAGFVALVADVLMDTRTDPAAMTLEFTESAFIRDGERTRVVLEDLRHLGVRLALDGFGTGYSSLAYLTRFPLDVVKVDPSLVAAIEHDDRSRLVARSILDLAHGLGMTVTAEGVETPGQYEVALSLGFDHLQGAHVSWLSSETVARRLIGVEM